MRQPHLNAILAAVALGLAACENSAEAAFNERVTAAAVASAPDPAAARVLQIMGSARKHKACGWMDTGGGRGVIPFAATEWPGRPISIRAPGVAATDPAGRMRRAYETQFVMVICDDHGWLPPMPMGVVKHPAADAALRRLVQTPGDLWVVVPAIGSPGYVGVSKASGGGVALSPVFGSQTEAQAWIDQRGGPGPAGG